MAELADTSFDAWVDVAVLRDASFYAYPAGHGLHSARTSYHVARDDSARTTACGRMAAEFTARPIDEAPENMRCQRPGCRQRWPKGD